MDEQADKQVGVQILDKYVVFHHINEMKFGRKTTKTKVYISIPVKKSSKAKVYTCNVL